MIKNLRGVPPLAYALLTALSLALTLSSCFDDNETVDVEPVTANSITFFAIGSNEGSIIEEGSNTILGNNINVTLPSSTDLTNLTPIVVHEGIRIDPEAGQPQNFTNPVSYTVTAANGGEKRYVVRVGTEEDTFTLTFTNTQSVTIPINPNPSFTYNYEVDSNGDGIFEGPFNNDATFNFQTIGPHTLRIRGQFPAIQFGADSGVEMADKVASIDQWGNIVWQSMEAAFKGCENLRVEARDIPNLSNVSNMASMFEGATIANPDVSGWNVGNVRNMANLFKNAIAATPNVESWKDNVVNVQDMSGMFAGATSANPEVNDWDVGNVADMSFMFRNSNFNQQIRWRSLNSTLTMEGMFEGSNMSVQNFTEALYVFGSRETKNVVLGIDQMQISNFTFAFLGGSVNTINHRDETLDRLVNELNWTIEGTLINVDRSDIFFEILDDLEGDLQEQGIVDLEKFPSLT